LCNSLKVINKSSELKRYRLVLFVQTIFVITKTDIAFNIFLFIVML